MGNNLALIGILFLILFDNFPRFSFSYSLFNNSSRNLLPMLDFGFILLVLCTLLLLSVSEELVYDDTISV